MLKTIFAQESKADAEAQWNVIADALREKQPKLGALMDASREDVLAYMDFPREHWPQIASTNPLERVNREIKRRADVVGIFPNDDAIIRLVGALMLEINDEWAVARRYLPSWGRGRQSKVSTPRHPRNLWRFAERQARVLRRPRTSELRPRRAVRLSWRSSSWPTRWLGRCLMSSPVSCFRPWSAHSRHHDVGEIGSQAPILKTRSDFRQATGTCSASPGTASRWGLRQGAVAAPKAGTSSSGPFRSVSVRRRPLPCRAPCRTRSRPSTCGGGSPRSAVRLQPWLASARAVWSPACPRP